METPIQIREHQFRSIEDLRMGVYGAALHATQLSSLNPSGKVIFSLINDMVFTSGLINADIRTRGHVAKNRLLFSVLLNAERSMYSFKAAQLVMPGDLFILSPGSDFDNRSAGSIQYATLSVPIDTLSDVLGTDAFSTDIDRWLQVRQFRPSDEARARLCASMAQFSSGITNLQNEALTSRQIDILKHNILETIMTAIVNQENAKPDRNQISSARIVRTAEQWFEGRDPGAVHIADLCKALHVSRRSLQRAFTVTLGIGPARYFVLKRLSAVREALRWSDPRETNVSQVATNFGFWELGRFAVMYKNLFGEKPSETLYAK